MLTRNFTTKIKAARATKLASKLAQKEIKAPEKVFSGRRDEFEALPYTPESAEAINQLSKVVLIRHGNSKFNQLFHKLEGEGYIVTPRYFEEYSDLEIIDSSLSPTGIEQCEVASTLANQICSSTYLCLPCAGRCRQPTTCSGIILILSGFSSLFTLLLEKTS
jgi:hypothetical protein